MPISLTEITDRYKEAFGYAAPRLTQGSAIKPKRFLNLDVYNKADSCYAEMEFESNDDGELYQFGIEELGKGTPVLPFRTRKPEERQFLAPPPMISISRDKRVRITPIDRHPQGGEVIEDFGMAPYRIKMQGILIDMVEHQAPLDLMEAVHQMFEKPGTFKVYGDIFSYLRISELFFKNDFQINFVEGYVDTIKFSVNAVQVTPAEFLIS